MPRYHFNIDNSVGYVPDEEGRELADLEEARAEALKGVRSLMADEVLRGRLDLGGRLEIADGAGTILMAIAFSEAVDIVRLDGVSPASEKGA